MYISDLIWNPTEVKGLECIWFLRSLFSKWSWWHNEGNQKWRGPIIVKNVCMHTTFSWREVVFYNNAGSNCNKHRVHPSNISLKTTGAEKSWRTSITWTNREPIMGDDENFVVRRHVLPDSFANSSAYWKGMLIDFQATVTRRFLPIPFITIGRDPRWKALGRIGIYVARSLGFKASGTPRGLLIDLSLQHVFTTSFQTISWKTW